MAFSCSKRALSAPTVSSSPARSPSIFPAASSRAAAFLFSKSRFSTSMAFSVPENCSSTSLSFASAFSMDAAFSCSKRRVSAPTVSISPALSPSIFPAASSRAAVFLFSKSRLSASMAFSVPVNCSSTSLSLSSAFSVDAAFSCSKRRVSAPIVSVNPARSPSSFPAASSRAAAFLFSKSRFSASMAFSVVAKRSSSSLNCVPALSSAAEFSRSNRNSISLIFCSTPANRAFSSSSA